MEKVATLGVTYASGSWTAGARVRYFGSHALIEDDSMRGQGSALTNVRVAYKFGRAAELSLDVFNLIDRKVSDVQYAYASRMPGEPAFAQSTIQATTHLHPSAPRTVRVGLKVFFQRLTLKGVEGCQVSANGCSAASRLRRHCPTRSPLTSTSPRPTA